MVETRRQPATQFLILAAVLLLAFALRVYRLDVQSLWYDEAVTAQVVQQGLGELARWTADDIQPPLYYALVAAWTRLAGISEFALRFPSACLGLLMVALAYVLGRRLFFRPAGLMAALLAAVHPLWVYYGQEARMYALLTALGMLAGYAILRVVVWDGSDRLALSRHSLIDYAKQGRVSRIVWWAVFVLAAVTLLYTHYFAVFILLAFALFFGLALALRRPQAWRRMLAEGSAVAVVTLMAYLPWLPNALRRFQVDASYWQGILKLDEALRHLAISFSTGETVLEQQAIVLAWVMSALALACLVVLLWAAIRQRRSQGRKTQPTAGEAEAINPDLALSILFVLLCLLVPIIAILALSYRTPKFNPRYLMLASPAFVLLLAGGLSLPFRPRAAQLPAYSQLRAPRAVAAIALAAVLAISLYATRNWFADPAFTKDDWRGAVSYVREQLGPDERVILVSGHALPAWQYYGPDIDPVPVPELEILDVNAVLDQETAAGLLNAGLAGQQGAWLLQWQDEVVDPTGTVPLLLDTVGQKQEVQASFWGLGSPRHYRFPAGTDFPTQPAIDRWVNANFANQVELVGFSQPPCPAGTSTCPVVLSWRALQPLAADLKLAATLVDAEGHAWSPTLDRRLAAYEYPTFRWPSDRIVISQVDLQPDPGTPPGDYRLRLGVYDAEGGQALDLLDAEGAAQGTWTWLEPITVQELAGARSSLPPPTTPPVQLSREIQLLQVALDPPEAAAGDRLQADLWFQATSPATRDYQLLWQWLDTQGTMVAQGVSDVAGIAFPPTRWPTDVAVRSQQSLRVPPAAAQEPGPWQVRVGLQDPGAESRFAGDTVTLPVEVLPIQRSFQPPVVEISSGISLADQVRVVGVNMDPQEPQAGSSLVITVTWQAMSEMESSYTGFVHLVDASGNLVVQEDHIPLQGERPTTGWVPGEFIADRYHLMLPAGLPAGEYWLELGLYDASRPGLPRLLPDDGTDQVQFGPISIPRQ